MNPWPSRLGGFFSFLLLITGLVSLQISNAETKLLACLPPYGFIAIAGLIAIGTFRSSSRANLLCLSGTVGFVAYVALRALTSPVSYSARADLYSVLAALLVYGLSVAALDTSARRIALIISLLSFAVVHVLVGVVQTGLGENLVSVSFLETVERSPRATGLYVDPDHLAGLLEVLGIFGLSISCWSRWRSWAKVIVAYLAGICYLGLILTGSRAGYLSVAASSILFVVLSLIVLRSGGTGLLLRFGGSGLILLTAAVLASGLLVHQSPLLRERFANILNDDNRLDLWRAAVDQWKLQPLIGTGSGTYRFYGRQFRTERMQLDPVDVHNDYLQLLSEYGLVGAATFLLFFCAHLRQAWKSFVRLGPQRLAAGSWPLSDRLALNIGALCAIGAYVVHSAVDFNLHIPANALLLAFVFGVAANPGVSHSDEIPQPTVSFLPRFATVVLGAGLLLQCVRLFPGEYLAERARAALRDENPSAAISFAHQALAWEKQNPNIFFFLGRALAALAHKIEQTDERTPFYNGALAAFEEARRLSPLDGTYALDSGFIYDEMGRFAEAEWMYGIARSRDPRSVSVGQQYEAHLELWEAGRKDVVGEK